MNPGGFKKEHKMAALISGIIATLATVLVAGISAWISTNQYDQQQQTIHEQFEYTKERNEKIDEQNATAVQTRAKDLAAAGINPMLAGLSGAQVAQGNIYSAIPTVHQGFEGIGNIGDIIAGIGPGAESERANQEDEAIRREYAQIERTNSVIERYKANTQRAMSKILEEQGNKGLSNDEKRINNEITETVGKLENATATLNEAIRANKENERARTQQINNEYEIKQAELVIERVKNSIAQKNADTEAARQELEELKHEWSKKTYISDTIKDYIFKACDTAIDAIQVIKGVNINMTSTTKNKGAGTKEETIENYDRHNNYRGKTVKKTNYWEERAGKSKKRINKDRK